MEDSTVKGVTEGTPHSLTPQGQWPTLLVATARQQNKNIPTKYGMCPNQYVLFNVYIVSNVPTKEEFAKHLKLT